MLHLNSSFMVLKHWTHLYDWEIFSYLLEKKKDHIMSLPVAEPGCLRGRPVKNEKDTSVQKVLIYEDGWV